MEMYPFAFPCLVAGGVAGLAVIAGYFALDETLPSRIKKKRRSSTYGSFSPDDSDGYGSSLCTTPVEETMLHMKQREKPTFRSVLTPHVISILTSFTTLMMVSETLFALYPIFAFTPVQSGGLGLSEAAIGMHLAIRAANNILVMLLFSPLQRRVGTVRTYQISMAIWPFAFMFFPVLNLMAKKGSVDNWLFNVTLMLFFTTWSFASLAWPASSVMVNDAAPTADSLGVMNSISQMAISLPQALAPAFTTSLFAFSINCTFAHGNLVWIIFLFITCSAAIHSLLLKEPTHDWRDESHSHSAESI